MEKYFGQNRLTKILILLACMVLLITAGSFIRLQSKLSDVKQEKAQLQKQIQTHEKHIEITEQLLEEVRELQEESAELRERMKKWLDEWEISYKEVTAYAPLDPAASPGQCYEGNPRITASGKEVKPYYTAAAGTNLPIETLLYVVDKGWYEVQDRGGAIGPGQIDLAVKTKKEANTFGRQNLKVVFKK